jgi:N-acetylmuramoyl-L-alanine amidase
MRAPASTLLLLMILVASPQASAATGLPPRPPLDSTAAAAAGPRPRDGIRPLHAAPRTPRPPSAELPGFSAAEVPRHTRDGRGYVSLDDVAAVLKARSDIKARSEWTPTSVRARLTVNQRHVVVTRNWAQVLVDGEPLVLSAPARVSQGEWLVPEEFLVRVVARVVPQGRIATKAAKAAKATKAAVVANIPAASPALATFVDLRVRSYPSFTRVVIEAEAPFTHKIERGAGEIRARLTGLTLATPRAEFPQDDLVSEVRLDPVRDDVIATIKLETAIAEVRASTLTDPFRLVLDLARAGEQEASGRAHPLRLIVLDAGHGGHDPGATGPTGLMEKDVVLDVTQRVAKLVTDRLGTKVLLSRSGDYFVPLRDRTSFANRERADLFISIHANAHRESAWTGIETYFLSSEATDNTARQLAALENGVVQLESPASRQKMDVLRSILWDLAQSEFQVESSNLAEVVQDSMTQSLQLPNRGVKQAGFYVLGGAAMPAILIEIGFVTNPKEERRLRDTRYRDEIAQAIFAGIAEYKKRYDQRMRTAEAPRKAR